MIQGTRVLDPPHETTQLQWLLVPAVECPDDTTENQYIACYFRIPHEPWGSEGAFVAPVTVRRTRRRVLFYQTWGFEG